MTGTRGAQLTAYASAVTYTAHGAVRQMTLGNTLIEQTSFNSRLQPTDIRLGTASNSTDRLHLTYDYGTSVNNGNVRSQSIAVPGIAQLTQAYAYDSLNRLTTASESGASNAWSQAYLYDETPSGGQGGRFGNRRIDALQTTANMQPVSNPSFNLTNNRIAAGQGYAYDAAGNLTSAPGYSYQYDLENRMVGSNYDAPNQQAIANRYVYDGDGQRVQKVTANGQVAEVYVYNAWGQLVCEYNNLLRVRQSATSYLTSDTLGTPRVVTQADGSVKSRHDYLPFGEELSSAIGGRNMVPQYGQTDGVQQKFTGYERDNETGLDFAQARYYNSQHGRFTSPDNFLNDTLKEDPASWNLYAYVRNNPLNATDPSGEILQLLTTNDKDGKVMNQIDDKNRGALLGWLNHTYGCESCVTINKNNQIQLDISQVSKNVLAATKDLTDAINDKNHIAAIVGYEGHANVNFAKAISANDLETPLVINGKKADVILVDFKDFRGLSGDKAAVSAFTNYAFVHEVFHLFPSLTRDDISDKDVTGPVENKVNEIRQVRGDLLRATYSAESDNGIFGSMYFGPAKVNGKTGQIKRNVNNGIIVDSKKLVNWNLRMTGN